VLPQALNAFRRQGDKALPIARHHHGQAIVITIRQFAGHGGSLPSGFAREKLRLNVRRTWEFRRTRQNELLELIHEQPLDSGTAAAAGRAHPD
jgi:hypothetical protein